MTRSSLQVRFLAISILTSATALLFAAYAIGEVIRDVVMDGAEEVFSAQEDLMRGAIASDGRFHPEKVLFMQEFSRHPDVWGWTVETPGGNWHEGPEVDVVALAKAARENGGNLQLALGRTEAGNMVHVRHWRGQMAAGKVDITIVGPDTMFQVPFDRSRQILWLSMGVVAVTIAVIVAIQMKFGFAPLRELSRDLAQVRGGQIKHLSVEVPDELRPLAREINALIEQNEAGLSHARLSVANLAHGLKTPLATLSLRLAREGASEKSLELLQQLDTRITHHLGRARSAALNAGDRARSSPALVASRLADVLNSLYADRQIRIENLIDPSVQLAVESEDLDEMLGNLLENACRFAASRIDLRSDVKGRRVMLVIEDDGPGLDPDEIEKAMLPGARLDDTSGGFGLGLGLVRELAELYGGDLELTRSGSLSGLAATLVLPLQVA